jgi:phage baseplate assembly protein W
MVPVASEISIPFRLGQDSHILAETIPDAQIRQHVMSLVNTEPGERVVLGGYGVPLSEMLFEDDDEETASDVAVDIANAMATYEPGVQIQELQPIPGPAGDGLSMVSFKYLRTDAPSTRIIDSTQQNVAVISVGGKVTEVVRG